jgi:hypothetical protein
MVSATLNTCTRSAGLVDGQLAPVQPVDLALVDVGADDVVSGLGKAGAGHQADVPASYNGDVHACSRCGFENAPLGAVKGTTIANPALPRNVRPTPRGVAPRCPRRYFSGSVARNRLRSLPAGGEGGPACRAAFDPDRQVVT